MADGKWQEFDPVRVSGPDGRAWAPLSELIGARAERDRCREAIESAPHARHCEASASLFPGPCSCWKREALDG
jgi:hypothetical protein